MKKYIYILIVSFALESCGGGASDEGPEESNLNPTTPVLISPTNNLLCVDATLNFSWNAATDADGNAINYLLEIATDNQFANIVKTRNNINATSTQFSLETGTSYYWRVKARDEEDGASEYSSVYQFYTEGVGLVNHIPFLPALIGPEMEATVSESSVTLEWTASDVDNDTLMYDLYFGTTETPELVSENQSETTYVSSVSSASNYYWKVVVKDGKGGASIGPVWRFSTN